MKRTLVTGFTICSLVATGAGCTVLAPVADGVEPVQNFNRIASFSVRQNLPSGADPDTATSADIIVATEDERMLVYTDSLLGAVGFVDLTDPTAPAPGGVVKVEGKPTSVAVKGSKAYVVVENSENFTKPSGYLAVIDIASKVLGKGCDLGGQPNSVTISDDGTMLMVAVDNPRNDHLNDGSLSQLPPGHAVIVPLMDGQPDCSALKIVDPIRRTDVAGENSEHKFVGFNAGET